MFEFKDCNSLKKTMQRLKRNHLHLLYISSFAPFSFSHPSISTFAIKERG